MGDRGNIAVTDPCAPGEAVFLYGHWSGYRLPGVVWAALAKKERWTDAPYLTRIIFDALRGDDTSTTGFGISTRICDNEYPIIVINTAQQTVEFWPRYWDGRFDDKSGVSWYESYPFSEFIRRYSEYVGWDMDGMIREAAVA